MSGTPSPVSSGGAIWTHTALVPSGTCLTQMHRHPLAALRDVLLQLRQASPSHSPLQSKATAKRLFSNNSQTQRCSYGLHLYCKTTTFLFFRAKKNFPQYFNLSNIQMWIFNITIYFSQNGASKCAALHPPCWAVSSSGAHCPFWLVMFWAKTCICSQYQCSGDTLASSINKWAWEEYCFMCYEDRSLKKPMSSQQYDYLHKMEPAQISAPIGKMVSSPMPSWGAIGSSISGQRVSYSFLRIWLLIGFCVPVDGPVPMHKLAALTGLCEL